MNDYSTVYEDNIENIKHDAGFFSCSTIRLNVLTDFYNKYKKLPKKICSTNIYEIYKVDTKEDISLNYFDNYNNYSNFDYNNDAYFHYLLQFIDYSKLDYSNLSKFIEKYFSPSDEIKDKIKYLKTKYNIDYNNICVLFYRGNDKNGETKICSYDEYIIIAKQILINNPNIRFLIQSDETEFIHTMISVFPNNSIYFKDEIRHINRHTGHTVDAQYYNYTDYKIDTYSKFYLAITIIMSKCKYIICGSGNCSLWIALYRNNSKNMYQNLNGVWIENN